MFSARPRIYILALVTCLIVPGNVTYAKLITLPGGKFIDMDTGGSIDVVVDDETGDLYMIWKLEEDGGMVHLGNIGDNPNPEGGDSGLGPDKETINAMLSDLLKAGGSPLQTLDIWETFIGKSMTDKGKGPAVTDPWDGGERAYDPIEGYGGGGGGLFDLNAGGIKEQITHKTNKGKGKGNDDDDEDDDGGGSSGDKLFGIVGPPELVNPVPIDKGFLLMRPGVATNFGRRAMGANQFPNTAFGNADRGNAGFGSANPAIRSIGGAASSSAQLR
jgi:hypothetical protein